MLTRARNGFTLVELLVTLVVASILLAGLVSVYLTSVQSSRNAINAARLDQSLHASLTLMANDIRRAGFWGQAKNNAGTGTNTNPFMASDIAIDAAGDCILLAYDANGDGSLPSVGAGSDDERYGFRLENNAIQARPPGAVYDCAASANAWENITDPNVMHITALNFSQADKVVDIDGSGSGTATVRVRTVTITVTGELASDPTVTKTLTEQVKIRNDKYVP